MYPSILEVRQNFTDITGVGSAPALSSSSSLDYFPTGGEANSIMDTEDDSAMFDFYSSSTSSSPGWLYPTWGSATTSSTTDQGDETTGLEHENATTILDCTTLDSSYDPGIALILVAVFVFGILFCIFGTLKKLIKIISNTALHFVSTYIHHKIILYAHINLSDGNVAYIIFYSLRLLSRLSMLQGSAVHHRVLLRTRDSRSDLPRGRPFTTIRKYRYGSQTYHMHDMLQLPGIFI